MSASLTGVSLWFSSSAFKSWLISSTFVPNTAKSSVKVKAAIIGPISPSEKITIDRKVESSRLPESQNAKPQGSTQINTEGKMAL